MDRFFPVVLGSGLHGQLDVAMARLGNEDLARKIVASYCARREFLAVRENIGFCVRANGAWALVLWGSNSREFYASVAAHYAGIAGVDVVTGHEFAMGWPVRQNAERTMQVHYCAKPDSSRTRWTAAGKIRITVQVGIDGAFTRIVECKPPVKVSGKLLGYLRDASEYGTLSGQEGGYLATTPAVLGAQLREYCLEALGVGRVRNYDRLFRVEGA